jgi:uncharacterized protein (DUF4415 family)
MTCGRPSLPAGKKMITLSLRLPVHVVEHFKAKGNASTHMRAVLVDHMENSNPSG